MCDYECFDVDDEEIASRLELKETTGKDCLPGEPSGAAFTAADLQAEEEMALETERSSPSGASSPGPSRDVVHRSRAASDSSAPSPPIRPASASPLTRFEPETAHGDISGTRCSVTPLPPHDPLPPPAPFFPRPPLPSPASPASSSASSYHAGSPPLAPIFLPPYHHHLSPFAPPPPPPPIVAPQAILALGGLTLGGSGHPPPPMDPATVCGWPQEFISPSPARPLPHHPLTPLLGPYSTHHHHQQALLRLRPSEEALSTTPRPQRPALPQPQAPSPLPFSVDNILRPAFGLRAVLEEEERGRRRLLLGGKDRGPSPPPTLPPLPPLPAAPKKKRKAPEAIPPPLPTRDEAGGPQQQTAGGPLEAASSPAKAEGADGAKVEPKLPNPENGAGSKEPMLWPAWVYCTRYSDRPSSGPRSRRVKRKERAKSGEGGAAAASAEEKRPRTAFSAEQLSRLKQEFAESRYLTEKRRQTLARDLRLNESQIKIWFQNKRAKIKKASGQKGGLALQLMAQGLYNHSTVPVDEDEEEEAAAAAAAANAAAEEEKRRQAAMGIVGPPPPSPLMVGGGGVPGAMPLDTRPPPLLVER